MIFYNVLLFEGFMAFRNFIESCSNFFKNSSKTFENIGKVLIGIIGMFLYPLLLFLFGG